ncbi:amino acid adenylation domain-containing protein [Arsenicicoccus piscis]|uniref:Amino acid adenylation protein n=1 Tax=Arsenicicoccus piscis TaxID=673954 RepID=A0ABQ6HM59_9MICO|nr:Pls/PosA family non-ribosomal peptide synthetase [Arsenicicoccus piscis]MCH8628617.1 amino acid adenylation domain-containing protein [Arsenicicoccus piscis]GMA19456.1 amino acid adenylation protein [Arsenicicoccus piscis]
MSAADTDLSPLRRHDLAPEPRTLVDIFRETAADHGDQPALDNGAEVLTYDQFAEAAGAVAASLAEIGVGRGDRVGVRIASGSTDLYVAIMGILLAGAAYVPVDADDPDERARTVFGEAAVAAVVRNELTITAADGSQTLVDRAADLPLDTQPDAQPDPELGDDAWIIFTSGSTGKPKGVAVSHRSAAAFVDAESRLFLQDGPIGPGDRVMAGLSVAFDASCEEMWLAWRYGAALVPAPRSLVRSGMDLGPWLISNRITVVSTVPTLVSLWPAEALAAVRLLILGGEACPPEIGARLANERREVWNTYGPTEATVVACAARLDGVGPVRIGLPLDGWDLEVVDEQGAPVAAGEPGELIIGGVGLARYLDPAKDAEKYAPMPTLGWERAYRSGDLVRRDDEGLLFLGRADDQVKVGGRRIELGEIDSALLQLPGVEGAAAAVRTTASGTKLLVGYLTADETFDVAAARERLRQDMPAALVPRLAVVPDLPTRTSGKIDRDALPWPLPESGDGTDEHGAPLTETEAWIRDVWTDVLGARADGPDADFFDLGGGSLAAAQVVARLRERHPETTVAVVYERPRLGDVAGYLDELGAPTSILNEEVPPVPLKTQVGQVAAVTGLRVIGGARFVVHLAAASTVAHDLGLAAAPTAPWWAIVLGWLVLVTPVGRILLAAGGARLILRGLQPGRYPRGGKVHLRIWLAERLADELGAGGVSGAALLRWYARLLGARLGRDVDLHTVPPITGLLKVGDGASIEPEVDLTGHWIDGRTLHVDSIGVGKRARVGARSSLGPGTVVGDGAEISPGSGVLGTVPPGERWAGAPAGRTGRARPAWGDVRPQDKRRWTVTYALTGIGVSLLPVVAVVVGVAACWPLLQPATTLGGLATRVALSLPLGAVVGYVALALLILVLVRLLGALVQPGPHLVQSAPAWAAWATMRVLDEARTWLFPLYSSAATPAWLRALGARLGRDVEASTVLMLPSLVTVGAGAFLADDTLIGSYELGGGWLRVEQVKVGKHAFVGNSGMAAPGRKVPSKGLVAVLSAAPRRTSAKKGSSWIGSPPERLRRSAGSTDDTRTFNPPQRLRVARALVELCRGFALLANVGLYALVGIAVLAAGSVSWWLALVVAGPALVAAGALAAVLATAAKWLLVGRVGRSEHPLWSSFVWRNELADAFVESVAVPWFARYVLGTPVLVVWLRSLGARIGRGVWCESYWLPEADLVELGDGATVNRGTVVQTHLFHDRVLACDSVTLRRGATLGPNSVVLPASTIGRHATVGPASLVMRGESVPDLTRWIGNPIGPWVSSEPSSPEPSTAQQDTTQQSTDTNEQKE